MKQQAILAVGTLRADFSRGCTISTEEARRTIDEIAEKDRSLVICRWYYNLRVLTISNFSEKKLFRSLIGIIARTRSKLKLTVRQALNFTTNIRQALKSRKVIETLQNKDAKQEVLP